MQQYISAVGGFCINLLIFLAVGCGTTRRTEYQSYEKNQGYRELPVENDLRVVNFRANQNTTKYDAELFAKFRSIEICWEESRDQLSHILDVKDLTQSKDVIRSSSHGFPSSYYYYGMSPFYNRFHSSSFGLGFSTMSSNTWEETYVFPEFLVYFECVNKAFGPEIILREVSAEEMKLLVKDLKGGLQVERIMKGSPNANKLEVGDVIVRASGERIESIPRLLHFFSAENQEVPVEILREGERKRVTLKSSDVTSFIKKSQEHIIQAACSKKEIKQRAICKAIGN